MSDIDSTLSKYLSNYFFLLKKSIRLALPLVVQVLFILASLYFSVIYRGLGFVSDNIYPLIGFYTYFSMLLIDYTCARLFAEGVRLPKKYINSHARMLYDLVKFLLLVVPIVVVLLKYKDFFGTELTIILLGLYAFGQLLIYRIVHEHSIYRMSENIKGMFSKGGTHDGRI
jgi:hypothetical protein